MSPAEAKTTIAAAASESGLPSFTVVWGGSLGLGLWRWRGVADLVGTEFYADWRRPIAWAMPLVKLAITSLVWCRRPWVACVNAYVPVDTKAGPSIGMPAWALRLWERLAKHAGARGLFVLGWAEAKDAILAAWPPEVR